MKAWAIKLFCFVLLFSQYSIADSKWVLKPGHPSLQEWILPDVPYPEGNEPTTARIELGKMLFFDPRLSGDGNMSCATCHSPMFGWSDGLPTAKGTKSKILGRASPTVINTAFNPLQMWDGRKKSLEDQAIGPMLSNEEMNIEIPSAINRLSSKPKYVQAFDKAYPKEGISEATIAKALASFERTVISNNSPFDRWVRGETKAMTKQQVEGFKLFLDPEKGNCEVCHSAPNFTDDGFHNIGLKSHGEENPDVGRYAIKPIRSMQGAFKTPTLREISYTAPYFHDGSAQTLDQAMDHYILGGVVKTHLSPNLKELTLTNDEKMAIIAFLQALSSPQTPFELPILPQ